MAVDPITAGIETAGAVGTSLLSNYQAKKNREFQEQQADKAYERQKEASDLQWKREQAAAMYDKHWNSIGQQKIRALAAGMNPVDVNLAAAPSTASPTAPDNAAAAAAPYEQLMSSMSSLALRPSDILGNAINVGQTALQYGLEKRKTDADVAYKAAQSKNIDLATKFAEDSYADRLKSLKLDNDVNLQKCKNLVQEEFNLIQSGNLTKKQIVHLNQDIEFNSRCLDSRVQLESLKVDNLKASTENIQANSSQINAIIHKLIPAQVSELMSRSWDEEQHSWVNLRQYDLLDSMIPNVDAQTNEISWKNKLMEKTFNESVERIVAETKLTSTEAKYAVANFYVNAATKVVGTAAQAYMSFGIGQIGSGVASGANAFGSIARGSNLLEGSVMNGALSRLPSGMPLKL